MQRSAQRPTRKRGRARWTMAEHSRVIRLRQSVAPSAKVGTFRAIAQRGEVAYLYGFAYLRLSRSMSHPEREEQILRDLVKGLPNKIIARKLDIAETTVKVHLKSILRKIRAANRTQAAIWALENGYGVENLHPELPRLEATLQPIEAPRQAY
jgi:DNA-binding NarL/FixJ family response regulator